ncbi:hypothetical protein MN116_006990 [Schistosoma mekongi]|uniref:Eukaryotic translation initiation factor 4E n=1 Tax=Schistosoma mekongi TaxID=38744 RepID=A0AAE1Z938_SCHME|nr:hypothetical protein MN116_006990 [Schistosoma mekongi]
MVRFDPYLCPTNNNISNDDSMSASSCSHPPTANNEQLDGKSVARNSPVTVCENNDLRTYRKSNNWDECLEKVATFSTIEHFWSVLSHTHRPKEMTNGNDLYMFKCGIVPKWEDPKNENGGRWLINISPRQDVDFKTKWQAKPTTGEHIGL